MNKSATLTKDQIITLIKAGGEAPSGGNVQPWLVNATSNQLEVSLNQEKLGTILDIKNYGSIFSLGMFVQNIIVAAHHLKLSPIIKLKHTNDQDRFTILLTFHKTKQSDPELAQLYPQIKKRATNRNLHEGSLISQQIINQLQNIAKNYPHHHLHCIQQTSKKGRLAKILGQADVVRTKHPTLLKQMLDELRWNQKEVESTRDGIDINTMELPGNVDKMLLLLKKHPNLGKTLPAPAIRTMSIPLLENSSHLCFSSSTKPLSLKTVFTSGRFNQHLWLKATELNLAFHPWTVLSFLHMRAQLPNHPQLSLNHKKVLDSAMKNLKETADISHKHTVVFIFRLSKAEPPSATALRYPWHKYTTLNLHP